MARTSEAPKIKETSNGETREVHPAYGKITVTSPQGGKRKLFASNILHHSTISMVIETAELERKLGTEWVFGNKRVIEIEMTHAQYAHMIASTTEIRPAGIGRFWVRCIIASVFLSKI